MNANDVALYLQEHPDFFEAHADLFSTLQVPHPHGGKAIPLAERQIMGLRERIRLMELKFAEMIRHARDNEVIADHLLQWTQSLLALRHAEDLPQQVIHGLAQVFQVPGVAVRLWNIDPQFTEYRWAEPVSDDLRSFTNSMQVPYCGPNGKAQDSRAQAPSLASGFEAARWLDQPAQSVALVPLRINRIPQAFGLIVLGSPDAERFSPDLGTAFLSRIADLSSAVLSRLTPA